MRFLLERATKAVEMCAVAIVSALATLAVLNCFVTLEIVPDETGNSLMMLAVFEHVSPASKAVIAIFVQAVIMGDLEIEAKSLKR